MIKTAILLLALSLPIMAYGAPGCYVAPALPCTSSVNCSVGMTVSVTGVMNCGASWCDASHCAHTPTCITGGGLLMETGNCQLPGTCSVFWFLPPPNTCSGACNGDCVDCAANCGWTACTGATTWVNGACGGGGCLGIQREQTRTGLPAGCTGGGPFTQCVADVTCAPPVPTINSFTASPSTILLGDQVTLAWTATSATAITYTLDQGIGAVSGPNYFTFPPAVGVITYTLTATNAAGSTTATASVTVNPSPPRCGLGHICGNSVAAERPAQALPGMVVELRDSGGRFLSSTRTDATGHFDFAMPNADYFIRPVPDRLWNPSPGQMNVRPNNTIVSGNFAMRFVPAKVSFAGVPTTFVQVTTYSFVSNIPVPQIAGSSLMSVTYSIDQMVPPHGVELVGGRSYWFKCWVPHQTGQAQFHYVPGPPQQINGGNIIWPQEQFAEVCQ